MGRDGVALTSASMGQAEARRRASTRARVRRSALWVVVLALAGATAASCGDQSDDTGEDAAEVYDPAAAVAASDPRPQDLAAPDGTDDSGGEIDAAPGAADAAGDDAEIDPLAIRGEIISQYNLSHGDCFNHVEGLQAGRTVSITARLDCAEPHTAEVFHTFELDVAHPAAYPGDQEMRDFARRRCYDHFEAFVGMSYELSVYEIDVFTPDRTNFEDATARYRGVHCWLHRTDREPLSGTARGTAL